MIYELGWWFTYHDDARLGAFFSLVERSHSDCHFNTTHVDVIVFDCLKLLLLLLLFKLILIIKNEFKTEIFHKIRLTSTLYFL